MANSGGGGGGGGVGGGVGVYVVVMLMKLWSEMEYGTGVTATSRIDCGSLVKTRSKILSSLVGLSMTWVRLYLFTSFINAVKARCG